MLPEPESERNKSEWMRKVRRPSQARAQVACDTLVAMKARVIFQGVNPHSRPVVDPTCISRLPPVLLAAEYVIASAVATTACNSDSQIACSSPRPDPTSP
jgi:hypothetical protein